MSAIEEIQDQANKSTVYDTWLEGRYWVREAAAQLGVTPRTYVQILKQEAEEE